MQSGHQGRHETIPREADRYRRPARLLALPPSSIVCRRLVSPIPKAVVACIVNARLPTDDEIEAVADRIWRDVRGGNDSAFPASGTPDRRQMLALARAALGMRAGLPEEACSPAASWRQRWPGAAASLEEQL